jgi:hypothetical protein
MNSHEWRSIRVQMQTRTTYTVWFCENTRHEYVSVVTPRMIAEIVESSEYPPMVVLLMCDPARNSAPINTRNTARSPTCAFERAGMTPRWGRIR